MLTILMDVVPWGSRQKNYRPSLYWESLGNPVFCFRKKLNRRYHQRDKEWHLIPIPRSQMGVNTVNINMLSPRISFVFSSIPIHPCLVNPLPFHPMTWTKNFFAANTRPHLKLTLHFYRLCWYCAFNINTIKRMNALGHCTNRSWKFIRQPTRLDLQ